MIRRLFRIGLWLGLAGGIALAVLKLRSRAAAPAALMPAPAPAAPARPWVEPTDGGCPASHPVKAKLSSKIFHLPGMANYERTIPDRCYVSAEAAEADGLRPAKR